MDSEHVRIRDIRADSSERRNTEVLEVVVRRAGRGSKGPGAAPLEGQRREYAELVARGVSNAEACRVLGMDRAPEVKTIRRKIGQLAEAGKAGELLGAMAAHHLHGDAGNDAAGVVLYIDGHVRAYQGAREIGKTHLSRLRFPAPATVETWVSDAEGDPVLVDMAEPGASRAIELRRLLPELRNAVGDDRRVLVGFDRGGWSPALFAHMAEQGFDVLTWRKSHADDINPELF